MRALKMAVRLGCATLLAVVAAGCGSDDSPVDAGGTDCKKVSIASTGVSFPIFGVYLANDQGFFKEAGLCVDIPILKSGTEVQSALVSGSVDFAANGSDAYIQLAAQRPDVRILVGIQNRLVQQVVVSNNFKPAGFDKPYPDNIRALKGARVGVTAQGASTDLVFRYLAIKAGLNPDKDFKILAVGAGDTMIAALKNGEVDAIQAYEPVHSLVTQDLRIGTTVINLAAGEGPQEFSSFPHQVLGTTDKYLKANPDTVKAVVQAQVKALEWMRDPANYAAVLADAAKNFPTMSASLRETVVKRQIELAHPEVPRDGIENIVAVLTEAGSLPKAPNLDDLLYTQYVTGS